jgi:CDGSH-type Zn-finger protein
MKITLMENGPILVNIEGECVVRAASGEKLQPGPLALCRCGQSQNKPFCDGTHRKNGFQGPKGEIETRG